MSFLKRLLDATVGPREAGVEYAEPVAVTESSQVIEDVSAAPAAIQAIVRRVTSQLVACPVRIVPSALVPSSEACPYRVNGSERAAYAYYTALGFQVVRLDHFEAQMVGHQEDMFPESKALGEQLRKWMPPAVYKAFIHKPTAAGNHLTLDTVYPRDYRVSFYPPDFFICHRATRSWRFVEVKGPRDSLHFRQANWLTRLKPKDWPFEIFALASKGVSDPVLYQPRACEPLAAFIAAEKEHNDGVQVKRAKFHALNH